MIWISLLATSLMTYWSFHPPKHEENPRKRIFFKFLISILAIALATVNWQQDREQNETKQKQQATQRIQDSRERRQDREQRSAKVEKIKAQAKLDEQFSVVTNKIAEAITTKQQLDKIFATVLSDSRYSSETRQIVIELQRQSLDASLKVGDLKGWEESLKTTLRNTLLEDKNREREGIEAHFKTQYPIYLSNLVFFNYVVDSFTNKLATFARSRGEIFESFYTGLPVDLNPNNSKTNFAEFILKTNLGWHFRAELSLRDAQPTIRFSSDANVSAAVNNQFGTVGLPKYHVPTMMYTEENFKNKVDDGWNYLFGYLLESTSDSKK